MTVSITRLTETFNVMSPLPIITATRDADGFEPISVLIAELTHLVIDGKRGGFVGYLYDKVDKSKVVAEVRTDGTYHLSNRFRLPVRAASGSNNYNPVADSILAYQGDRLALNRFTMACELACDIAPAKVKGVRGWMGTEVGLGVYFPDHFLAWFAAYLGSNRPSTHNWVEFALSIVRLSTHLDSQRVMPVGQRGALPGRHKPGWNDALYSVMSTGGGIDRWRQGYGWPNIWKLLNHWRTEIYDNFSHLDDFDTAKDVVMNSTLMTRVPWTWGWADLDCMDLAYTLQHETVHGSTPPMLAAVPTATGEVDTAPWKGGAVRRRDKGVKATCDLVLTVDGADYLRYNERVGKVAAPEQRLNVERARVTLLWEGRSKSLTVHRDR